MLARQLPRLSLQGRSLERILAQLLAVCIRSKDAEGIAALVAQVPATVTWDILAYNLACHFAVVKNEPEMLRYVQRSLDLGKSPTQFLADSDFAPYVERPAFKAILAAFA